MIMMLISTIGMMIILLNISIRILSLSYSGVTIIIVIVIVGIVIIVTVKTTNISTDCCYYYVTGTVNANIWFSPTPNHYSDH